MNAAVGRGDQVEHDVERFDLATARSTGQSAATVRRDAERGETKLCAAPTCGKTFKTTSPNAATCSPACAKEWQASKLDKRNCQRCNTEFQPPNDQAIFCSDRCLHLAKEARKKAKRHEAMAEQPERICENPKCGKPFRPKRIAREQDRFCCNTCRRAAEYQRLKAKACAAP